MGIVLAFRQSWRGPLRTLAAQRFPRMPRLLSGLRRHAGFLALFAVIGLAAFLSGPWFTTPPRTVSGAAAAVIDGDSLRAGGIDIRLIGIDAPELRQTCRESDGREWPCGRIAKERLAALASRGELACAVQGYDRYSRMLAVCSAGEVADLGEALVREGYAVHYGGITTRYTIAEAQARTAGRGMWRGPFERPEDWRAGNRRRATSGSSGR
jgi:endonuclease YncB( thermonuclease family)